jgi:hypothetical protein
LSPKFAIIAVCDVNNKCASINAKTEQVTALIPGAQFHEKPRLSHRIIYPYVYTIKMVKRLVAISNVVSFIGYNFGFQRMSDLHKSTRLGDLLIEQGVIEREQLNQAIAIQQARRLRELQHGELTNDKKELGEILIELNFIDRRQLHFSLSWQRRLRKTTAAMVFIAPLLTAACGGGGGEKSSPAEPSAAVSSSLALSSNTVSSVAVSSVAVSSSSLAVQSSSASSPNMQSSSVASSSAPLVLDGPVQLYWAIPTQRENGEILDVTEIAGYELRYKLKSATDYTSILLEDGFLDAYYFDHLQGDYEFEIATYDTHGLYSNFVAINPS